jgi:hypothetical protein
MHNLIRGKLYTAHMAAKEIYLDDFAVNPGSSFPNIRNFHVSYYESFDQIWETVTSHYIDNMHIVRNKLANSNILLFLESGYFNYSEPDKTFANFDSQPEINNIRYFKFLCDEKIIYLIERDLDEMQLKFELIE